MTRRLAQGFVMSAIVALVAIACDGRRDAKPSTTSTSTSMPTPASTRVARASELASSSIAARDYIGPDACGECHPDQHAAWSTGLHRVMNQRADGDAIIGDFEAASVRYAGGEARFTRDRVGSWMTLTRGDARVRYRVTRTIGRRALQEYVGVEVGEGGTPEATGDEVRLPFGWWPRRGGWYPQPYFDPWLDEAQFDAYAPVREPWAERCPWCHSTYAFEQRIARAAERDVGHGLEQYFVAPASPAPSAAPPSRGVERLEVDAQVSVGISCESCHLGGRAHADGAPIHFVPLGAWPRPGAPVATTFTHERNDARIVNAVCAQCHSGPSPRLADGTALRNSSEALDLAASPCTTAKCTDCHDPHGGGADISRSLAACAGCHSAVAAAGRTHSGHDGATCLDCHMPPVVMGVDRFVRTHRISSPTDPRVLAAAGPNACNLCHLDRSIRWTVDELRLGHEVRLDPRGWDAYRGLDVPVGDAWLASDEPALRLIAGAAYARAAGQGLAAFAIPALRRALGDPLAHVRAWSLFSLEQLVGRRITDAEYDPRAPPAERARAAARLVLRPTRMPVEPPVRR